MSPGSIEGQVQDLRARMRAHPCHSCPEREDHARWAARWWSLRKETDDLQRGWRTGPTPWPPPSSGSATC
ncbi:hypothetical protein [Ornithinimicrobium flavum]|uniref:hypothetical protein n=1 Tax=Ornithinimicrobium flavum TaxID=1288636 RepID=UPI003083F05D